MNHLIENNDLLERYILKRLDPKIRADVQQHIEECPSCREAVERERIIAGGVRSFARQQLKDRLKEGVRQGTGIPWPHILSAAAMVLLVVGLGYYNSWWAPEKPPLGNEIVELDEERPSRAAEEGEGFAMEESPPVTDPVVSEPELRTETLATESPRLDVPIEPRRERVSVPPERREIADQELTLPSEDASGKERESMSRLDDASRMWVQGIVVNEKKEADEPGFTRAAKSNKKSAASEVQKGAGLAQLISVTQQPLRNIPPGQRDQQVKGGFLSTVNLKGEILELTLFSDTLDLARQKIRVDPVTGDSLIITINGMQIAYKIPGGWGQGKSTLLLQK